jgi:hypothetical protein
MPAESRQPHQATTASASESSIASARFNLISTEDPTAQAGVFPANREGLMPHARRQNLISTPDSVSLGR